MTYEKATNTLRQFRAWRDQDGQTKMPRQRDITEAINLAIDTLQDILDGKVLTSPAELRFNSLGMMIEDFVRDNKK